MIRIYCMKFLNKIISFPQLKKRREQKGRVEEQGKKQLRRERSNVMKNWERGDGSAGKVLVINQQPEFSHQNHKVEGEKRH